MRRRERGGNRVKRRDRHGEAMRGGPHCHCRYCERHEKRLHHKRERGWYELGVDERVNELYDEGRIGT